MSDAARPDGRTAQQRLTLAQGHLLAEPAAPDALQALLRVPQPLPDALLGGDGLEHAGASACARGRVSPPLRVLISRP